METSIKGWPRAVALALVLLACGAATAASDAVAAKAQTPSVCKEIVLSGDVSAGHEWKAAFGQGWIFRVVPIPDDKTAPGVGGWDLVVDRDRAAGFPDALLLASPPYHFISQREIATTFGLRAQDAIGWNPRKFRFMTSRSAFREAHRLYLELNRNGAFSAKQGSEGNSKKDKVQKRKMQRFLRLAQESSPGVFQIQDAHLTPGDGNVKPYALNWARQAAETPHTDEPPPEGKVTPLGKLEWVRFSVTLWLPQKWRVPHGVQAQQGACPR